MTDPSPAQRRIVSGARNAARILALGGLLAVAVVLTRLLAGGQSLQVASVSVPVDRMWLVFTALTVAHAFTARFLAAHIKDYRNRMPSPERAGWVFDEITTEGNVFVHGMISRAVSRRRLSFVHRMSRHDPSAWVARGASILLVIAVPPWWWGRSGLQWNGNGGLVTLALVLPLVNWWAGSKWLISLSRLEALRNTAERSARDSVAEWHIRDLAGLPTRLFRPLPSTVFERSISTSRWLAERPLPISDTPAQPPVAPSRPTDPLPPVESLTDSQRADIAITYLVLRASFPEADLPADPWFVTDAERSQYQSHWAQDRFQVASDRRHWTEIELSN
ncbi:hypothetical protein AB0I98_13895 [Streptomyces sp. NPDC050211]|uniref:hypothetical protein n=1 Tax=Streptomyces sp. NPDC050211 TaxID=3154932 RepID=UPI0034122569